MACEVVGSPNCSGSMLRGSTPHDDDHLREGHAEGCRLALLLKLSSKPIRETRRADSNRLPLLHLRVLNHVLQGLANSLYLEGFPFSAFPRVAPYCVPGGVKRCQEFGRWRSHVFLRSLLVPATLNKRGIPPFDRFKLLFGQPFAYFGFEA
jgi:hypothetical protein